MTLAATAVIVLVALLHLYFLVLEMFFWDKPLGLRTFRLTRESAAISKTLAANQGLYNGFLAAGLVYALVRQDFGASVLFSVFVIVAGVYGTFTASRKIFFVQVVPGVLTLLFVLLAG